MDLSAVRLNLSYVLHEPSTSATVTAAAGRLQARQREIGRLVERVAPLSDEVLRQRLVVWSPAGPPPAGDLASGVATVRVGAWQLVGRALTLVSDAAGEPPRPRYIDEVAEASPRRVPFFRGQAALRPLGLDANDQPPGWFAALLLRPGGDGLLLRLSPLPDAAAALSAAETTIREFVDQWWCPLPLWARPVELALPEFAPAE